MEVEILVKKFKSTFALTAILMVTVLLSGCFGGTKTFTLTVNVVPEGAAAVSGVATMTLLLNSHSKPLKAMSL